MPTARIERYLLRITGYLLSVFKTGNKMEELLVVHRYDLPRIFDPSCMDVVLGWDSVPAKLSLGVGSQNSVSILFRTLGPKLGTGRFGGMQPAFANSTRSTAVRCFCF